MTNRSNLGVSRSLSTYTNFLGSRPNTFLCDGKALPMAPVGSRTGQFYTVGPGMSYASPGHGIVRTSGAAFKRVVMDVSQTSAWVLKEYGLEVPVDDVDRDVAGTDELDLYKGATALAWQMSMIERERDLAGLLFNAAVITQTAALGVAARWDVSSVDPRVAVETGVQTVEKAIGTPRSMLSILMGAEVFDKVRRSGALLQYFCSMVPGTTHLNEQQLALALDVGEVIVGRTVANSAAESITASNAYIWGKSALIYYKEENPQPMTPNGIGATFAANFRPQGRVERYREEPRTNIVLPTWFEDRVVTNASAGYLLTTVVS